LAESSELQQKVIAKLIELESVGSFPEQSTDEAIAELEAPTSDV